MSAISIEHLERWCKESRAQGRLVLRAERVDIFFTLHRHRQTILFNALIIPEQLPEFFCVYPTRTWIRGDINQWTWEPTGEGKTRLWVPTELSWRSLFIGEGIGKILPLDGTITGSAGFDGYRRTDCWWVSFLPLAYTA